MQRQSVRNLPANKTPIGTRCIQITIPDDDEWERDIYSEVYRLALWMLWERDIAKSGKPVADRWLKAIRTWKHCSPPPKVGSGLTEDFELPLRVDCDCNVFVTCCDGTEKQILTSDQVNQLIKTQPGTGTTPPGPGECKQYDVSLKADGVYLVPLLVNAGDTLTLSSLDGATSFIFPFLRWNCPTGLEFFGGLCVPAPSFDATALLPAAALGKPLFYIGGVYYDATIPLTVPGGVANAPAQIFVNYPTGLTYAGTITATLTVCNNASTTFTHTFDFVTDSGGFAPFVIPAGSGSQGIWVPGTGWTADLWLDPAAANFAQRGIDIHHSVTPARTITQVTAYYTYAVGSGGGTQSQDFANGPNAGVDVFDTNTPVPSSPHFWAGSHSVTQLDIGLFCGSNHAGTDPGGSATLSKLIVTGIGSDPF